MRSEQYACRMMRLSYQSDKILPCRLARRQGEILWQLPVWEYCLDGFAWNTREADRTGDGLMMSYEIFGISSPEAYMLAICKR